MSDKIYTLDEIKSIAAPIARQYGVDAMYLFGSYALTDRATLQLNVQTAADEKYILRTNGVHHADPAPARSAILTLNLRY